jgi:hypothetical protein
MAGLVRARKITLPDGSSPFFMDGRIILSTLPQFITVTLSKPILTDGEDYQDSWPRQFSFTSVGKINGDSVGDIRRFLQSIDTVLGLRNRRYYLNSDHYWQVRSQGYHFVMPYAGVRTSYIELELYLQVMDPYLRDDAGNLYRSW